MVILHEIIDRLCKEKGITAGRMCNDLGFPRSTMTELRKGRNKSLSMDKIAKIADYLDVATDYLLGRTDDPTPPNAKKPGQDEVNLDELEFALFGEVRELNDEEKEELLRMARRMRELDELRKEKDKQ